ncbi:MAG: SDR family NAD(P)-dependent oxidoreductase [Bacteroidales bacterium]
MKILITGATSGIGRACAELLASKGYELILTGRRKERLLSLKTDFEYKTAVHTYCFDISKRKEAETHLNRIVSEHADIEVLINNAGLAAGLEHVSEGNVDNWERMIDTNVKGLLYASKILARSMKTNKKGQIINISSIAGRESYPNGGVYCASKHAVQAITDAMRVELLADNIRVSSVCPGAVNTEFSLVRFDGDKNKADKVYEGFEELVGKDIAEAVYFVLSRPSHVNIADMLILPSAQGSARDIYRKGYN